MTPDTDIAIIGGGPVGAALALALINSHAEDTDNSRPRITVLEARAQTTQITTGGADPRPIALSYGSRLLLERFNAWQALNRKASGTAIDHVHVSQRGGFGRVALSAADADVPQLGYVYDFNDIFLSLAMAARTTGCDYRSGVRATALSRDGEFRRIDYTCDGAAASLTARLVVIADGGDIDGLASPKTIDYAQLALTARVSTSLPHRHVAYERFTPDGPLALLPFDQEMALVWTLKPARAETLRDADAATFLAALREAFGGRLGDFTGVTRRACHALSLRLSLHSAARDGAPGIVTIGNAAQTLHPVAGQGFNLGLRDAWELAQMLRVIPARNLNCGDSERLRQVLHRYHAGRRIDRYATIAATHGLVQLFSNDIFPLRAARGVGMTLLGALAPARNYLARRMIFGARG